MKPETNSQFDSCCCRLILFVVVFFSSSFYVISILGGRISIKKKFGTEQHVYVNVRIFDEILSAFDISGTNAMQLNYMCTHDGHYASKFKWFHEVLKIITTPILMAGT